MKNAFYSLLALLITFTLTNCKKTEEEVKGVGDVVIEMDNHAGDEIRPCGDIQQKVGLGLGRGGLPGAGGLGDFGGLLLALSRFPK